MKLDINLLGQGYTFGDSEQYSIDYVDAEGETIEELEQSATMCVSNASGYEVSSGMCIGELDKSTYETILALIQAELGRVA